MTRHRFNLALLGALAALPACDTPTAVEVARNAAPSLHASTHATELPMRGTFVADGSLTSPEDCAGLRFVSRGGGQETHTGRYAITTIDCVIGDAFTGSFTKVAANGDLLFGTYGGSTEVLQAPSASSPLLVLRVTGMLSFVGGTGRFAGASGSQTMVGRRAIDVSQATLPVHTMLDLEGSISLVHPTH
jgi:hypothetical protein